MTRFLYIVILSALLFSCKKDTPGPVTLKDIVATKLGLSFAVVQSGIVDTHNATILQKGFCWSSVRTDPNIDSSAFLISSQSGTSSFSDTIKGLTYNTKYYIRAYATTNSGTYYGKMDSLTTLQSSLRTGQTYQGGYIFLIDNTGEHGYIACKITGHNQWGAWATRFYYAGTNKELGTGQSNTQLLMTVAGNDAYAAKFCDDLVYDGYSDWFLPSYEELRLLRTNLHQEGNIFGPYDADLYWTSSEVGTINYQYAAWFVPLNAYASFSFDDKDADHSILPIRKF